MTTHPQLHRQPRRWLSLLLATLALSTMLCIPAFSSQKLFASDEGAIELTLTSELPNLSEDNRLYSYDNARFGIYEDYQCQSRVDELVTDAEGHARTEALNAGRYFIRQEQASPGFAMNESLHQVEVAVSRTATLCVACTPAFAAPDVLLQEISGETNSPAGIGGARLGNAIYSIAYYDSYEPDSALLGPTRTWRFISNENGEVLLDKSSCSSGSPLYEGPDSQIVLPLGRYTVSMETEPLGFQRAANSLTQDVMQDSLSSVDPRCSFTSFEEPLLPIRGDVMFRKTDGNGIPMAGIPFLLISENGSTKESHVVMTNELGDFCSHSEYVAHSQNTNENDRAVLAQIDSTYKLDETKLQDGAGLWFSRSNDERSIEPNNGSGALPYGSYVLQELPCSKNEGMNLSSVRFSIHRNDYTVVLDTIVNTKPGITGHAYNARTFGKHVMPDSTAKVCNEISYQNLVVGKRYMLSSTAQVTRTGASVVGPDGSPSFAYVEFTPAEPSGAITVEMSIDTTGLAGETLSLLAELKSYDGMLVQQKNDIPSEQELMVEPVIALQAHDSLDNDRYCMGQDASVRSRMSYEGLNTNGTYTLISTLNDKATGNALRDAQGNAITKSVEFVPESRNGYVDAALPFDADATAGHDVVVFSKLVDESGAVIADHRDFDDAQQTIKTVKLGSSAFDRSDGDKMFDARATAVTICDTVNYANLEPGKEYALRGTLMNKETGTVLMQDDTPITATVPFVPSEVSGSTDVEYSFDATKQSSQVIVVFETLEHDGKVIAQHTDLEDVAQTVTSEERSEDGTFALSQGTSGKGKAVTTGDIVARAFLALLALGGCAALCIACALRHKRRVLESIARSCNRQR